MPDERIPITFYLDAAKKEIHRKKGKGDEILEDKVVATYDPDTQLVIFPSLAYVRAYKLEVTTFLSENELIAKSFQRGDIPLDKPTTKAIPPRPKKSRGEGDKTAAVVEWYKQYKPNEFATRYGVLGTYTGLVAVLEPQWVPRPVDGISEYRGQARVEYKLDNVLVATRKTHLTYLPEECVDWDEEELEPGEQVERRAVLVGSKGEGDED